MFFLQLFYSWIECESCKSNVHGGKKSKEVLKQLKGQFVRDK